MHARSPSPSPPPYNDPERQRLLPGSSTHAAYSGQASPDSPRRDKRANRYPEPAQESYSYHPRSYSTRSPSRPPSDGSRTGCPIWVTILLLFLAGSLGFYSGYPSDSERNHIRQRWELDRKAHAIEVEKWYKDRDARRAQESEEVERFQKEEQELVRRREEMNETYRNEEHAWRQKVDNFKEEWQRMVDEETRKRERARLYWDDVKGDEHCLSNGRKRYTARLANLTPSLDAMEACRSTPLALNGVTYEHPVHCESTGGHGVRGHWVADNEGVCAAYWEFVKIKDCTAPGSGYRRIEAKLGTVHAGENPEVLCLTTPLNINEKTYSRPLACPDWGVHGYWGIWNVPDEQCK